MSGGLRSGNLEPQGQAPGLNGSGSFLSRKPRTLVQAMFTHSDRGGVAKWPRRRSAKPLFSGSNPLAASTPTPLMRAGLPETPQCPAGCGQRPTGAVSATGSVCPPCLPLAMASKTEATPCNDSGGSNPRAASWTPATADLPEAAWPVYCHARSLARPRTGDPGARKPSRFSYLAALHCRRDHRKREPGGPDGGVTKLATVEGLKPSVRKDLQVRILPPLPSSSAWPERPCARRRSASGAHRARGSLSRPTGSGPPPRERARRRRGTTPIESVAIDDAAGIISRCGECGSRLSSDEGANGAR